MAVRIRLQRKGAKHRAFYRIVAADSRSPRDGRFLEQLGYYDPLKEPADINVNTERVLDWFSKGAKPTETVKSLFSRVGIMETWHEVRQGKSYDELHHIEEDARKRAEAAAAMQKRKKEDVKLAKKAAKTAEEDEAEPAADEAGSEATGAEEAAAEPTAEPQEAAEETPDAGAAAGAGGEETAEMPAEAPATEDAAVKPAEAPATEDAAAEPEKTEK
ncbi:MAG: 30S ribosomal protein S16 [Candidatus Eisenbacteria sp.]|nr:30S ribosomal protein S16 [Candidatus Eisenbacteria bacterium]